MEIIFFKYFPEFIFHKLFFFIITFSWYIKYKIQMKCPNELTNKLREGRSRCGLKKQSPCWNMTSSFFFLNHCNQEIGLCEHQLQTVPRRALFAPIVFAGRQCIASRWPGIPSGRWGQLFPPRSAILVLSFLLHISFMLFLGTTLTLKPRTVGFLETNRSSVERKVPKLPAKFPERGHFFFFRSSS